MGCLEAKLTDQKKQVLYLGNKEIPLYLHPEKGEQVLPASRKLLIVNEHGKERQ